MPRTICNGLRFDSDRRSQVASSRSLDIEKNAPKGTYKIRVHNFSANHSKPILFQVGIVTDGGDMDMVEMTMPGRQGAWKDVKTIEVK